MANLILPSRFNRQPQYPVDVDRSSPLSDGLYIAWNASIPNINCVDKKSTTQAGTGVSVEVNANGLGQRFAGNGTGKFDFATTEGVDNTYIIVGDVLSGNQALDRFISSYNSGSSGRYDLYFDNSRLNYQQFRSTSATQHYAADLGATPSGFIAFANIFGEAPDVFYNGSFLSVTQIQAGSGTQIAVAPKVSIGGRPDATNRQPIARLNLVLAYGRKLSQAEIVSLYANPWQIFRKRPQILYFDVGGATGVTGTGSLTTGATTASGSGTLTHTGTGSLTSGVTTLSGAGTLTHTGTGALTTLAATLSGAGVLTHVGTGSLTTGNVTLAGEGNVTQAGAVSGTGALTVSAITASGTGTISHNGTGSLQTSVVTLDGAGVLTHTGTGDLTTGVTALAGEGSTLGTITGTGALTIGNVTVSGYDVLPVAVTPTGGGGTSTVLGRKRQKLIIVERVEDVEELLEQVEEIVQAEPKARKLKLAPKKPKQTVQNQPEAAFDWLSYYQAKLDTLRDQQRAESLKRQLDKNAEIIRVILAKQEEEARLALELQQEEEVMLLLMAA